MMDRLGALRIASSAPRRLTLRLSRFTRVGGACLFAAGMWAALWAIPLGAVVVGAALSLALLGLATLSLRRELVFDREAGTVAVSHSILGLARRELIPLFHLRAVVVAARPGHGAGFVAYLARRKGSDVFLDTARHSAQLMKIADAISLVTDLRVEYDATSRMSDAG